MPLSIASPAFAPSASIPRRHTCEGPDASPPLAWQGAPDGTRSFALIVDDPDVPDPRAPKRTFTHWVIVDLPAHATALDEDASGDRRMPSGAREGRNDAGGMGWSGPCPSRGRHRYFFKLYALDTTLPELDVPTKDELEDAMKGHVIDQAEVIGTYEKA